MNSNKKKVIKAMLRKQSNKGLYLLLQRHGDVEKTERVSES
jgi:hypothetical protein